MGNYQWAIFQQPSHECLTLDIRNHHINFNDIISAENVKFLIIYHLVLFLLSLKNTDKLKRMFFRNIHTWKETVSKSKVGANDRRIQHDLALGGRFVDQDEGFPSHVTEGKPPADGLHVRARASNTPQQTIKFLLRNAACTRVCGMHAHTHFYGKNQACLIEVQGPMERSRHISRHGRWVSEQDVLCEPHGL